VKLGWRTAAAVLIAAAGLATAGAVARPIAASLHSRVAYGTLDPNSVPARIDYCGRRYYADAGATWTREKAASTSDPSFQASWREIGRTDGGTPYYAMVVPDTVRRVFSPPIPCTMLVYLRVGPDVYSVYPLSGGP